MNAWTHAAQYARTFLRLNGHEAIKQWRRKQRRELVNSTDFKAQVDQLRSFLATEEGAIKQLLAATADTITFGLSLNNQGSFSFVAFTASGLVYFSGSDSSYSRYIELPDIVTTAVEYVLLHNGSQVTNVTAWFIEQVNTIAKRNYKF